jgi:nucleotide-binding universal stress UspA family protein
MVDITAILCPVDRFGRASAALAHAVALASQHHARLRVLRVFEPPPTHAAPASVQADLLNELGELIEPFRGRGIVIDARLRAGRPDEEILGEADSFPAELLVMGTHSRAGPEPDVLRSVAETVVRKASCPVLIVPAEVPPAAVAPYRTILCATDFSAAAARAVDYGFSMIDAPGCSLILVHVIGGSRARETGPRAGAAQEDARPRRDQEAAATERLTALLPPAARMRCRFDTAVAFGTPASEIVRLARDRTADVIVMGVYGTGSPEPPTIGSTTHQVICEASCPVLTVRFGAH